MSLCRHFPAAEGQEGDQERAGCDVLSIWLRDAVATDEEGESLPSLLATGSVVGDILGNRQEVVVGTNLGLVVLDLRSRAALQVVPFTQVAEEVKRIPDISQVLPGRSQFASMASCLALAAVTSRGVLLVQVLLLLLRLELIPWCLAGL